MKRRVRELIMLRVRVGATVIGGIIAIRSSRIVAVGGGRVPGGDRIVSASGIVAVGRVAGALVVGFDVAGHCRARGSYYRS